MKKEHCKLCDANCEIEGSILGTHLPSENNTPKSINEFKLEKKSWAAETCPWKHVQGFVKDSIETKDKSKVNIIKKSPRLSPQHKDLKPWAKCPNSEITQYYFFYYFKKLKMLKKSVIKYVKNVLYVIITIMIIIITIAVIVILNYLFNLILLSILSLLSVLDTENNICQS